MNHDRYISPLSTRYAGKEMQYLFSEDMKFTTFHKLWIALAKAEKAMGVAISEEQIAEMEAHLQDIDYEKAAEYEKALRHDVMAGEMSAPRPAPSFIWVPPPAMWVTTPT